MRVKHLVYIFLLFYTIFYFNFFNLTKMNYTSGENYNSKELFVSEFNNYHKNKNVIIGMLAKYKWNIVKPFFHTLSNTNYKNEIICFVLDESDSIYNTYYQKYNITPIYFSLKHPYLYNNNTHYPIPESYIYQIPHIPLDFFFYANIRFFFLNIFLQIYSNSFSYILTTDIRDMFFQSNPFHWNYSKGVYLSHETQHCLYRDAKKCNNNNYRWIIPFNPSDYILNKTYINNA